MSQSQLEIQLKMVLPCVQSGISLAGFVENFLSADADFQNMFQFEATFRFRTIEPSSQSILTWLPFVSFVRHSAFQELNYTKDFKTFPGPEPVKHSTVLTQPQPQPQPQWVCESVQRIGKGEMVLCESGVGGTYFISNDNFQSRLSVFKPIDEEPGAPNNPKKTSSSFTPMIDWGSGAHREVSAYKLDKGFVGVPETHFVELVNANGVIKKGSLQKFIQNDGDCSDVGANKFSVDDVHRLGIFDIRILNMDRNDENLLVQKTNDKEWKIIPIDHTYAFPKKIDSYFNWQYWNQTKKPFSVENLDYIASINVFEDAKMLLATGIDEESVRNVMGATLLLQKAASLGFNLFEIASMVSGKKNDLVTILAKEEQQRNLQEANNKSLKTFEEKFKIFKTVMEEKIEEHLKTKALK